VFDFSLPEMDAEVRDLIEKRRQARRQKDFETADRIRDELQSRGIAVHDEKVNKE